MTTPDWHRDRESTTYAHETKVILDLGEDTVIRTIRPVRELPAGYEGGYASEDAVKAAVGDWGLPDFIFHPVMLKRGSAQREMGDALVLVGSRGIVLQAKHRENPTTKPQREASWVDQSVMKAHKQAAGTIRALQAAEKLQLMNLRGRQVHIPPETEWLGVTILDHREIPLHLIKPIGGVQPLVFERQFWDFLFDQLRCTSAVIDYIWRRARIDEPWGVTDEFMLFFELTVEDQEKSDTEPETLTNIEGARHVRIPSLPAGSGANDLGQTMFRLMLDDLSLEGESEPGVEADPDRVHEVLSLIDQTPVTVRQQLGERFVDFLQTVDEMPPNAFRSRFMTPAPPLANMGFVTSGQRTPTTLMAVEKWLHDKHLATVSPTRPIADQISWALLMTPHPFKPWSLDFQLIQGDPGYTPEQASQLRQGLGLRVDDGSHRQD